MADFIDREQLLADIENTIRITAKDTDSSELRGARKVIDRIKAMPSADVQPVVHGKWIINITEPYGSHCSCCGFAWYDHIDAVKLNPVLSKIETNYCPNCGAKMEVDDEHTD